MAYSDNPLLVAFATHQFGQEAQGIEGQFVKVFYSLLDECVKNNVVLSQKTKADFCDLFMMVLGL